jgi:hypothetical protein
MAAKTTIIGLLHSGTCKEWKLLLGGPADVENRASVRYSKHRTALSQYSGRTVLRVDRSRAPRVFHLIHVYWLYLCFG